KTTKFDAPPALVNLKHCYKAREGIYTPKKYSRKNSTPVYKYVTIGFPIFFMLGMFNSNITPEITVTFTRKENLVQFSLLWTINAKATIAENKAYLFIVCKDKEPLYLQSKIVRPENFL
ncbi:LOW QUALITY PROTEIN: hypothetical protein ACHAXS_001440, partial [Conticribra weissflogii]